VNLNEDRLIYYQRQKRSAMTVVSCNIRLMRCFRGFLGDDASNDSGVIEKVDFQGFRTLRAGRVHL